MPWLVVWQVAGIFSPVTFVLSLCMSISLALVSKVAWHVIKAYFALPLCTNIVFGFFGTLVGATSRLSFVCSAAAVGGCGVGSDVSFATLHPVHHQGRP